MQDWETDNVVFFVAATPPPPPTVSLRGQNTRREENSESDVRMWDIPDDEMWRAMEPLKTTAKGVGPLPLLYVQHYTELCIHNVYDFHI
jgi:hypothetical protein